MRENEIEQRAILDVSACLSVADLDKIKSFYLGKKGKLTEILRSMKDLTHLEKREMGIRINIIRDSIRNKIDEKKRELNLLRFNEKDKKIAEIAIIKNEKLNGGKFHLLTQVGCDILKNLQTIGFRVVSGPEIEYEYYNFDSLNISEFHPARKLQDTFYVLPGVVLRTQTSPIQVRTMFSSKEIPIKICCMGKVYRHDQDSTHSPMFHQIEILYVDKKVSLVDLKSLLFFLIEQLFPFKVEKRFRNSFFPFTEPSFEVDIECFNCRKHGCFLCKMTGWIEVLGSGMVHPTVLKNVGLNEKEHTGLAIGIGVERVSMLKYLIPDIRFFYNNNIKFLSQF
ncbi:MAG: phenylalanine--tRNA ligase subunit alpha [Deltaproteobacteria bacterium]|nr:MAG: phenylalanine--tRNA ligase subunit alpha [Deltaproteobacteria bacterium]